MNAASVIIVGAGVTGMTAAGALEAAGVSVTVIDKAGRPGGRAAFGRIGGALVRQAFPDEHLRAAGVEVITSPEWQGSPVRRGLVSQLSATSDGLSVHLATPTEQLEAGVVLLTPPLPQALRILQRSNIDYAERFDEVRFNRQLELMAACADGTVSRTVLGADESTDRWDDDKNFLALEIAAEHSIADPLELQLKAWRYAVCANPISYPFGEIAVPAGNLILAGDAFAADASSSDLARAAQSGRAAAAAITAKLSKMPPQPGQ